MHIGPFSNIQILNFVNVNHSLHTMIKYSSVGNFRPFCTFSDYLQMIKVEKFASLVKFDDTNMQNFRIARFCAVLRTLACTLKTVWA